MKPRQKQKSPLPLRPQLKYRARHEIHQDQVVRKKGRDGVRANQGLGRPAVALIDVDRVHVRGIIDTVRDLVGE